jgi:hypothetical protein
MFELLREIIDRKPVENQSLYDFYFEQKAKLDGLCLNFSEHDVVSIILGNIGDSNITASVEASHPVSCDGLARFLHSRVFKSPQLKQNNLTFNTRSNASYVRDASGIRDISGVRDTGRARENSNMIIPPDQNLVSQLTLSTSSLNTPEPSKNNVTGPGRRVLACFSCGGNHRRVHCTVKCDCCGKRGHTESSCYYKKNRKVEQSGAEDKQDIKCVNVSDSKEKLFKGVMLNGIFVHAFIDTGSSCSILSSR